MSVSLYTTEVPTSLNEADSSTGTLGTAIYSDVAGTITAIRYYKGSSSYDAQTVNVALWNATGSGGALASGSRVQSSDDPDGWVSVPLDVPYHTAELTTFVASYQYPGTSHYVASSRGYATDRVNGVLHAPTDAEAGPPALHNGLYRQPSATIGFPDQMFQNSDYFVDVEFTPDDGGDTSTPASGSAALDLTAAGAGDAAATSTAALDLAAAGAARSHAAGSGTAGLTLDAAGAARASAGGSATLGLTAAAAPVAAAAALATLELIASGFGHGPYSPTAAFNFDAGVGTLVADATGNGHDGTFVDPGGVGVGLKWATPGVNGSPAMVYCDDVTTQSYTYVQVAQDPALEPTDRFTIMAWTQITDGVRGDTYRVLITKPVNSANDSIAIYPAGGDPGYPAATITTTDGIFTTPRPAEQTPVSTLVHMAIRYDGANLDLLIDGAVVATTPATGSIVYDDTTPWCMLGSSAFGYEWLPGDIDDARFFIGDVLTDTDIQTLMPIPVLGGATPAMATATLDLLVTGASRGDAVATAVLDLLAAGQVAPTRTGTASLSLTAGGSAAARPAGNAGLSLVAAGVAHAPGTADAALQLRAAGAARSVASGHAGLTLTATGRAAARAAAAAALSLIASGSTESAAAIRELWGALI